METFSALVSASKSACFANACAFGAQGVLQCILVNAGADLFELQTGCFQHRRTGFVFGSKDQAMAMVIWMRP